MANLPSHMKSLLNVNGQTNLPTNSTTTPSVSMITPLSPTPPHKVPHPQIPPPLQIPAQTLPTDINALRTKAALDTVKIVLRDVGKVLLGVRQGEKEMMDKVGELKVGVDRSIESSGREAIRLQQSGIHTLTAQILTQHTTLLSTLNSSSALQLSELNSSLTTTVQDFLSKHNLDSSRIIDHSLNHSITSSTKISTAVKALEGELKSGLARLGDKITEELKSASSNNTGAPGSNLVIRMREEARKEKDQALLKSLEEMKVGFDRIASALVQFMQAGERVEKESEDKKNEERREAVKRQEDSESRWMREVERRRLFEESQEQERKVLSLKFRQTEAGLESLSKQVSNLSAELIPLITLLPRLLPNPEIQPKLDTTSKVMQPLVCSSQTRTPSQPPWTQNSKQSTGKFSSAASSSSYPRLSATQGSSRNVFTISDPEQNRPPRQVADDLSPSSLPAFDSSPRFDGTIQPIKITPSHISNSAPQLNAVTRENVPHGKRSISSSLLSSSTGASAAIVVRKSSLKRRRILDDFESSDESTFDRLHILGSQRSLGDLRKTSIDIEKTGGSQMDSEPAKKKGGKRVIEQEADSQSQVEFEGEEVSGKENEVDGTHTMGQDTYVYEEEPDTEEESL